MTKIDGQIVETDGKSFLLKNGKDGYQIKLSSEQELAVQDTLHDLEIRQQLGGWRSYSTLVILLLANLLNYIDRYTIAGVLDDVQSYYGIDKAQAGLLQTSFILSYMLLSPIFGYLGDRYNRKVIMALGIAFWSVVTLAGSFVPAQNFYTFLLMRALVGVGEASYSTIAPTIIADLFVKDARTKALTFFYFAIPLGSGLGYIVGSQVAIAFGGWQWALRVTPGLGLICSALIVLVLKEPPRGAAEGGTHGPQTSYLQDIKSLFKNKSFILGTGGFACVAFVAGALAMWAPLFMQYAIRNKFGGDALDKSVPWKFGVITCVAGFLGVVIGSESGRMLRRKKGAAADPLVCAFGMLSSGPFMFAACYFVTHNINVAWVLIFIGEVLICLNWSLVTDMLLYIVVPSRRSTAEAIQILISHALGDAGSPYLIGLMSDSLSGNSLNHEVQFHSLQSSLYITVIACIVGGAFFLANAVFINADKEKAETDIRGSPPTTNSSIIGDDEPSSRVRLVEDNNDLVV